MLWDTASSVIYTFDSWNITLWDKIDVEFLVDECKKLAKEIKMLHKGAARTTCTKSWRTR